ncbi:hypothetical protein [Roseimaritima multifibrata]|uniref:hypothetical protein n=1 Tax=Roseimaritima multifibrata TaxID=1930274 RepID=UPI0011A2CB3F|nr:hypothetical protein [Roseimaritima multifibrata]
MHHTTAKSRSDGMTFDKRKPENENRVIDCPRSIHVVASRLNGELLCLTWDSRPRLSHAIASRLKRTAFDR